MSEVLLTKICSLCGLSKDRDSFVTNNKHKDGKASYCGLCNREYFRLYYIKNREAIKAKSAEQRRLNPEAVKDGQRRHYAENKIAVNLKNQIAKDANRDRIRLSARNYYRNNEAKCKVALNNRRYRKRGATGSYSLNDLRAIFTKQCGQCFWCGKALSNFHCDHYIPISKGGSNNPENIVLSCPTCNLRKHDKMPDVFREWLKQQDAANITIEHLNLPIEKL